MDPKDNDTQTSPLGDQSQSTEQQKADGELVVSHETELDTNSTNPDAPADPVLPSTDPTAVAGDVDIPDGSNVMGTDVGNGMPASNGDTTTDPMGASAAPMPSLSDQPAAPLQPFSSDLTAETASPPAAPVQPDAVQPGMPVTPDQAVPADPGVVPPATPVVPADPNIPAVPPVDTNAPMGGGATEGKNKLMVLLLIGIAAVVIVGIGIYALTAL